MPSLKDGRVPTKDELKTIFLSGYNKGRVSSVLVAHSCLRIEVLGNYFGEDGLKVKDLPEIIIKERQVDIKQIPIIVIAKKELSKARH
jgi:hypothetical protein